GRVEAVVGRGALGSKGRTAGQGTRVKTAVLEAADATEQRVGNGVVARGVREVDRAVINHNVGHRVRVGSGAEAPPDIVAEIQLAGVDEVGAVGADGKPPLRVVGEDRVVESGRGDFADGERVVRRAARVGA